MAKIEVSEDNIRTLIRNCAGDIQCRLVCGTDVPPKRVLADKTAELQRLVDALPDPSVSTISFEAIERHCIGWAVKQLHDGAKVRRAGWNGKGMWLSLSGPHTIVKAEAFWSKNNAEHARSQGGSAKVLPCVTMKTATGEILMGWLCSQTDLLATDWELVE